MKYYVDSHCAGDGAVAPAMQKEVAAAIAAIATKPARGKASGIRDEFLANLKTSGWSSEVAVAQGSDITITSMKHSVGLCLQTGNMARMYADLIKLQTLYLNNAIKSAVIVVPSAPTAQLLGSNIAQSTRLPLEHDARRRTTWRRQQLFKFLRAGGPWPAKTGTRGSDGDRVIAHSYSRA